MKKTWIRYAIFSRWVIREKGEARKTRETEIDNEVSIPELLQKMGLLCKDPESRPASPGQNHEDLLAIEDELRGEHL